MTRAPILTVSDLVVEYNGAAQPNAMRGAVVDAVSFEIGSGETLGLVGRSGAGKTTTALALLRLVPPPGRISRGRIEWRGRDLLALSDERLRALRGREIAAVFQDPGAALHPFHRVHSQIAHAIRAHDPVPLADALKRADALLERVGIPRHHAHRAPYPHQWSGGMRQRALLAMALAHRPALLIADEPTTALDVTTQAQILELLRETQRETGLSILFITHDLSLIAECADRVAVLDRGRIVESGSVNDVFDAPRHDVTRRMLAAHRAVAAPGAPIAEATAALRADHVTVRYQTPDAGAGKGIRTVAAVDDVSFAIGEGETLGLVGESGCGKSSLARALVRLEPLSAGRVLLNGLDLTSLRGDALRGARSAIQIVFQNPYASLNPRRTVGDSILEPLHIHGRITNGPGTIATMLELVGLPHAYGRRYPRELSGGERQRVAIARALALGPRVVILDEPVSSLDGPARAGIIDLLRRLQTELGHAYLFIAHDLDVVRSLAHRVAVMYLGRIIEIGGVDEILRNPCHPYTRALLAAEPARAPQRRGSLRYLPVDDPALHATAQPTGCRFRARCWLARDRCASEEPTLEYRSTKHASACHFADSPDPTAREEPT